MDRKNRNRAENDNLAVGLKALGIEELTERLEVSALAPGGAGEMGQDGFIDIQNCCNGGKCSGNTLPEVDELLDTQNM